MNFDQLAKDSVTFFLFVVFVGLVMGMALWPATKWLWSIVKPWLHSMTA